MAEHKNGVSSAMSLPLPPGRSIRGSSYNSSSSSYRTSSFSSSLPKPPTLPHRRKNNAVQSMTIDEMREVHQRAVQEAESKNTELRLVLASRYKELVGSSDEVIRMKERSQELHDLVKALPELMEKVIMSNNIGVTKSEQLQSSEEGKVSVEDQETAGALVRQKMAYLPRVIHRSLHNQDIYKATTTLIQLFTLIAGQTNAYPLATRLANLGDDVPQPHRDQVKAFHLRMMFMQVEALPRQLVRHSEECLRVASEDSPEDSTGGASESASALCALYLLRNSDVEDQATKATSTYLLDQYFDAKTALMTSLLWELSTNDKAESVLSKICRILQYDIILHPYHIFVRRHLDEKDDILSSLPMVDQESVRTRCTQFLSVHLPIIRRKTKVVLVQIAGTTASALGQIRQSLYDKTNGVESRLEHFPEAVEALVDTRTVSLPKDSVATASDNTKSSITRGASSAKVSFSLWGALFSHTFSSLVHSLLSTAFESVHMNAIDQLRASLVHAPPLLSILPHEAYRNTLLMATQLDDALKKVSDDAHELLVHAEEREESEHRLRVSLYVQTCEIMGRLVCELRRMVSAVYVSSGSADGVHEYIIGRLCFLLKFRLTSLTTLLDERNISQERGMLSYVDLQSAFDLADVSGRGLLSFSAAMEAAESAFSGSPFSGAEIVRETLLLDANGDQPHNAKANIPNDVTLDELVLLTARGLRHGNGTFSALGTIQRTLDNMVDTCLFKWGRSCISEADTVLNQKVQEWYNLSIDDGGVEYNRVCVEGSVESVSPHWLGYLLHVVSLLNTLTCPSDCLVPVPSTVYAQSIGISTKEKETVSFKQCIREAVVCLASESIAKVLRDLPVSRISSEEPLIQLSRDASFIKDALDYEGKNRSNDMSSRLASMNQEIETIQAAAKSYLGNGAAAPFDMASRLTSPQIQEATWLFLTSLASKSVLHSQTNAMEAAKNSAGLAMFQAPMPSSHRFVLLPIQADRSLADLKNRKLKKGGNEKMESSQGTSSVMSSAFGFLSSMRNKRASD